MGILVAIVVVDFLRYSAFPADTFFGRRLVIEDYRVYHSRCSYSAIYSSHLVLSLRRAKEDHFAAPVDETIS